jgi:hypothetical protein
MSLASHFRVKAELYQILLEHSRRTNNAVDRAWYEGLVRSYSLLAASEDRHYHAGLKVVLTDTEDAPSTSEAVVAGSKAA